MQLETNIFFKKNELNNNEMKFLKYVIENKKEVSNMNIVPLSEQTFFSAAFISKIIKKLGYQGFSDFKSQLKKELEKETIKNVNNLEQLEVESLLKTKNILNQTNFNAICKVLDASPNIYCFGTGNTRKSYMREFSRSLMFVSDKRIIFVSGMNEFESVTNSIKEGDTIIVSSYTGKNKDLLQVLFSLKNSGISIINISPFLDSDLSNLSHYNVYYFTSETKVSYRKKPYISFLSLNYCIDMFILEYISYKERQL